MFNNITTRTQGANDTQVGSLAVQDGVSYHFLFGSDGKVRCGVTIAGVPVARLAALHSMGFRD